MATILLNLCMRDIELPNFFAFPCPVHLEPHCSFKGVFFFAWKASRGRVLMLGRPLASRCYICDNEEETIEHLLVHCQ